MTLIIYLILLAFSVFTVFSNILNKHIKLKRKKNISLIAPNQISYIVFDLSCLLFLYAYSESVIRYLPLIIFIYLAGRFISERGETVLPLILISALIYIYAPFVQAIIFHSKYTQRIPNIIIQQATIYSLEALLIAVILSDIFLYQLDIHSMCKNRARQIIAEVKLLDFSIVTAVAIPLLIIGIIDLNTILSIGIHQVLTEGRTEYASLLLSRNHLIYMFATPFSIIITIYFIEYTSIKSSLPIAFCGIYWLPYLISGSRHYLVYTIATCGFIYYFLSNFQTKIKLMPIGVSLAGAFLIYPVIWAGKWQFAIDEFTTPQYILYSIMKVGDPSGVVTTPPYPPTLITGALWFLPSPLRPTHIEGIIPALREHGVYVYGGGGNPIAQAYLTSVDFGPILAAVSIFFLLLITIYVSYKFPIVFIYGIPWFLTLMRNDIWMTLVLVMVGGIATEITLRFALHGLGEPSDEA